MPHAVVIGAGPAGSLAGVLLARERWRVTLVEQYAFPRDKVCGECLSALGAEVLDRAQLRETVLGDAVELTRTVLHDAAGRSVEIRLPRACWGMGRQQMDARLLDAAVGAGAELRQPARAEAIDGRVATVRDLRTNGVERLTADYVLLADGKSGLVGDRPAPTGDLGVKAHVVGVEGPTDAVELFGLDGHYVGLNPVEPGVWNLAMSVPAGRVRAVGGDFERLLGEMVAQNAGLRRRLARATRVGKWLASPLPRFAIDDGRWPDGVIPLGNAAAALEPIGGEGMGLALRSAEIAVRALTDAAASGRRLQFPEIADDYRTLWRVRRTACRAGAMLMSDSALAQASVELLDANAALGKVALRLIGKA